MFLARQCTEEILVEERTNLMLPKVIGAILRGVDFNSENLNSFNDLLENLRNHLLCKGTQIAIGTHDL